MIILSDMTPNLIYIKRNHNYNDGSNINGNKNNITLGISKSLIKNGNRGGGQIVSNKILNFIISV